MYIQCICMYVYKLHIYYLFKKAHLHTNEMGACLFLHTELNLGWRFYATRDKSIFSIFHSGYFDFIIASAENASSHNSTVQHGRSVFKALSENGWKFYPSLKPKFIEQFFFCDTPISNTNSTFFFCFVFCVTACVMLYPYESKRLCTTEKSCSSRAVLNQGTLGGLCSISQVKDGTVQNYLIQRWGLPETLGTRVLFWINFLSL